MLFRYDLPFWVGAVGLAAIFSAEVSAADALLLMLATSFSQDVYKRFVNPGASDAQLLGCARLGAVAGAALAVLIAVVAAADIVDALSIFYTVLGVSLFVPVVAGLATRGPGPSAALASIVTGVGAAAAVELARGRGFFHGLTPPMWGIALAAAAYMIAAALIPRRAS
jgi:SSS family solute:Na+ symporter